MRFILKIVIASLIVSCVPFPETRMVEGTFLIENQYSEEIIIKKFYRTSPETTFELVTLQPQEIYRGRTRETTNESAFNDPSSITPITSLYADTIVFVFNNMKEKGYSFEYTDEMTIFSLPLDRNPTRVGSYEQIGDNEYLFKITQEDFDNAVPCDGPCL